MRNRSEAKHSLVGLLERARYEVLPTPSTEEKVLAHVPVDRTITVTASPSKGLEVTFDLAERLGKAGYTAVPHLAARMVSGRAELEEICARLTAAGITSVFVPGGDADTVGHVPRRTCRCSRTSRTSGRRSRTSASPAIRNRTRASTTTSRFSRCGTSAATPRTSSATSPSIPRRSPPGLNRSRPRHHAAAASSAARAGDRTKLLGMATKIGVGESTRFLAKNKGLFARLAAPGGFTGERFLEQVRLDESPPRPPSSRACTSSRSTRSPRPRPGARRRDRAARPLTTLRR